MLQIRGILSKLKNFSNVKQFCQISISWPNIYFVLLDTVITLEINGVKNIQKIISVIMAALINIWS